MGTMISWTTETWNPIAGCTIVSAGCSNCYAMRLAYRLAQMGQGKYQGLTRVVNGHAVWTGKINTDDKALFIPYGWKGSKRVFVNSMSDLFHEGVPDAFRRDVFTVMQDTPQHTYQILTKRPEAAAAWEGPWPANVWMGTSVEDARVMHRIDALRECKAQTRFLSCEPLIGPLENMNLTGIDWVIVGGESGAGFRPMDMAWARSIRDQCSAVGAAFFFKQDAAFRTETRTYLVEEDGTHSVYHQFPRESFPVSPPSKPALTLDL